jgi:hypothetical protein
LSRLAWLFLLPLSFLLFLLMPFPLFLLLLLSDVGKRCPTSKSTWSRTTSTARLSWLRFVRAEVHVVGWLLYPVLGVV